ncbi:urea ABC transporter permease subunit UrtB [Roseibium aestuarii]|uniref:Urea ABC transporter permease subunit UrtB n=1 Tax=Roseibium aestuarii TaxID=2600299 RepID=A0ABW4K0M8_9HYPH|nr:urea ABC transporter permease subunit UrtB [Roseibium aestuarii]
MSFLKTFLALFCLLTVAMGPVRADDSHEALRPLVNELASGKYDDTERQIQALVASGDPVVASTLQALRAGDLYVRKADGLVFIARKAGKGFALTDPLTGADAGEVAKRDIDKIKVNNKLRRVIDASLGSLTLLSSDPTVRLAAAQAVFKAGDPEVLDVLETALAKETDDDVRVVMEQARAAALLNSDRGDAEKLDAIETIASAGNRDALSLLIGLRSATQGPVSEAADTAIRRIEKSLALWDNAQNVWYGLSLGSVLLLAAIGLAITFGVMGVINMAHGEMVMIGAYVTFVVQEIIRGSAPWLFDYSLFIALPLAFLVSGAIGVGVERFIIRFLYGRPLETLLATWGLSLILQQAVRSLFGPTNREVGNPAWMSGAFDLGQLTITYNRMWIVVFAMLVFAGLMLVLKRTSFGLFTRAVTQNRRMAASMGIRTPWIDALTFGLGSGIAGIAGVALSQIDNVSPNLGQGYIIDSFMVVVFGGVGNLWGTLVGAMTLGVVNKFLEPYAGAVLGKILVLVFIILFIQKRPRGLFALKGRAVEA